MSNRNDFRSIWLRMPVPDRRQLADDLGTSYRYLQGISGGFKVPSMRFAQRMKQELPRLSLDGFQRAADEAGKRMVR